jgi:defect-in-organelle-trafficking protein DotC
LEQANDIFTDGLNRMVKDIVGRVTYLKLKKLNVLEPATVTQLNADMTFDNRTMNIGEVIYTIDNLAKYKTLTDWNSAVFQGLD